MGTTARAVEIFLNVKRSAEEVIKNKLKNELKQGSPEYSEEKIREKIEREISDTERGLRARARDVPALVLTHGLPSTLAYLCSKADRDLYNCLMAGIDLGKLPGAEERAYTIYLVMLVRFLREDLGLMTQRDEGDEGDKSDEWEALIDGLKKLDSEPQTVSAVSEVVNDFLLELKKVAEASLQ